MHFSVPHLPRNKHLWKSHRKPLPVPCPCPRCTPSVPQRSCAPQPHPGLRGFLGAAHSWRRRQELARLMNSGIASLACDRDKLQVNSEKLILVLITAWPWQQETGQAQHLALCISYSLYLFTQAKHQ